MPHSVSSIDVILMKKNVIHVLCCVLLIILLLYAICANNNLDEVSHSLFIQLKYIYVRDFIFLPKLDHDVSNIFTSFSKLHSINSWAVLTLSQVTTQLHYDHGDCINYSPFLNHIICVFQWSEECYTSLHRQN